MNTNPNSFKEIVAVSMGEYVCASHLGPRPVMLKVAEMGICYACAAKADEPVRAQLARRK